MIKLDFNNFRILRNFHLEDDTKLTFIVGPNGSGKSSLIGGIQLVATGTAFGRKGEGLKSLVTYGENRMSLRVQVGPSRVWTRTTTTGDSVKEIAAQHGVAADVLPLLYHQRLAGDGGNKHLKAFLAGVAATRFDARDAFKNDPYFLAGIEAAWAAGNTTTAKIVKFCEDRRANSKAPPPPIAPPCHDASDEEIQSYKAGIVAAQAERDAIQKRLSLALVSIDHLQGALRFLTADAAYKLELSKPVEGDVLGARRQPLERLTKLPLDGLWATDQLLRDVGYADAAVTLSSANAAVVACKDAAEATLKQHPPAVSSPIPPKPLATDAETTWKLLGSPATSDIPAMVIQLSEQAGALRTQVAEAQKKMDAWAGLLDDGNRRHGAWLSYNQLRPRYEELVVQAEADWNRWDKTSKAIVDKEREYIDTASKAFSTLVAEMASPILNKQTLTLSLEDGVLLNGKAIDSDIVSTSEMWRIEVAIMAAIARHSMAPLLMIDGADILDYFNMQTFAGFLAEHIVPHFEHVIVTSACRGPRESETPAASGTSKWWLEHGTLTRLP
jgi:hypothetical protein